MKSLCSLLLFLTIKATYAWSSPTSRSCCKDSPDSSVQRRNVLAQIALTLTTTLPTRTRADGVQAVGSGEQSCREEGNCLQVGEWDGAVGWNWGGKERCDPTDPLCGPDGRLRAQLIGQAVPEPVSDITHVAALELEIGRGEVGVLRLGFYGKDAPGSVQELLEFLSDGITTQATSDAMGVVTSPVALNRGGVVNSIAPGLTVDFGVPSQSNAYARSRGKAKATGFLAQSRPSPTLVAQDESARSHTSAGLVSVPNKGLGYGGSGSEPDTAFESSFLITAGSVPALDKSRRVVGQVLDAQSMAFLERLASLPTKKGIRGVIPGFTSGPPLLRVIVRETEISKVTPKSS